MSSTVWLRLLGHDGPDPFVLLRSWPLGPRNAPGSTKALKGFKGFRRTLPGRGGIWGIIVGIAVLLPLGAVSGSFLGWMLARTCGCRRRRLAKLSFGGLAAALGALSGFLLGLYYLNPLFPPQERFDTILSCVQEKGGLHACTHLATVWLDEPLKHAAERFW